MKRVRFGVRFSIFGAFRNAGVLVFRLDAENAMRLANAVTELRWALRASGQGHIADQIVFEVTDVA